MPRRTLSIILAVTAVSLVCYARAERNPYGRWISEVMETIDRQYIEPVDAEKLFEEAVNGMVGRLDDYSSFLPRKEKADFEESIDQQYGGIGIELALDEPRNHLLVMNSRIGGPAYRAGLHAGDSIIAIDGQKTENFKPDDARRLLRGHPGTSVAVTIRRPGQDEPLHFNLVRALIRIESVLGDLRQEDGTWNFFLPGSDQIGYVRINSFGESTIAEFEDALKWLADRGCRGVIIDMRNNPGGLLVAAERICDLFIPKDSLIVTTRGRDARERDRYTATGDGPYQHIPLVVLVNDRSASASEIVAACLQDHGRAAVVGQRTFGKGTIQNVIPIEGGKSLLKLTIASYWRPSGKNIHRMSASGDADDWGVRPNPQCEINLDDKQFARLLEIRHQRDVLVPHAEQASASAPPVPAARPPMEFDPQLERAVEVLKQRISASSSAAK
jgi:carboxyl-terminal processing protease